MRPKSSGVCGWTAAALLAIGAGAFLGASGAAAWDGEGVQAGLRLYARLAGLAQRLPLGFLLPIIAMTVSFRAGSHIARRVQRRSQVSIVAAPRPSVVHYGILFTLGIIFAIVYAVSRGLL